MRHLRADLVPPGRAERDRAASLFQQYFGESGFLMCVPVLGSFVPACTLVRRRESQRVGAPETSCAFQSLDVGSFPLLFTCWRVRVTHRSPLRLTRLTGAGGATWPPADRADLTHIITERGVQCTVARPLRSRVSRAESGETRQTISRRAASLAASRPSTNSNYRQITPQI